MNARFAQTLLVASLGAFTIAASADNATPRDNPAGANAVNATQQGTQTGETSSTGSATPSGTMANPSGTTANPSSTTANPSGSTMTYKRLSDADIRAYKDARAACDRLTGNPQSTCFTQLASTWSQVDPKCQKLSGAALDDCLKGADRGAQ